jgi:hypothetical protein
MSLKVALLGLILAYMDVSSVNADSAESPSWDFDSISRSNHVPQDASEAILARHVADTVTRAIQKWNNRDIEGFLAVYDHSSKLVFVEDGKEFIGYDKLSETYHQAYDNELDLMGIIKVNQVKAQILRPNLAVVSGEYVVSNPWCITYYKDNMVMCNMSGMWKIVFERASMGRSAR